MTCAGMIFSDFSDRVWLYKPVKYLCNSWQLFFIFFWLFFFRWYRFLHYFIICGSARTDYDCPFCLQPSTDWCLFPTLVQELVWLHHVFTVESFVVIYSLFSFLTSTSLSSLKLLWTASPKPLRQPLICRKQKKFSWPLRTGTLISLCQPKIFSQVFITFD